MKKNAKSECLYQSNERLFVLAYELQRLNQSLIALHLDENTRLQIMREYAKQESAA